MVMMMEPIVNCLERLQEKEPFEEVIYMTPDGETFNQSMANSLSLKGNIAVLCGHYKGVDERIRQHFVTREISIGDYVLGGGEVAAMVALEAVGRLVPGVMGNSASAGDESFSDGLLEYPQFTKPFEFRGMEVPEILRSGDHGRIARWRRAQSLRRTLEARPDLIEARGGLTPAEEALLADPELAD